MKYSVSQLAQLAGVTQRTLRYYDRIGLLPAQREAHNQYRYYGEAELLRLQQILFYRALDLELSEIAKLLNASDFSLKQTLKSHRQQLQQKKQSLSQLIQTVDYTLSYLEGKEKLKDVKLFEGFSEEQQEEYAKEAAQRWDPELVRQSQERWKRASEQEKQAILKEGEEIYKNIAALMERPVEDQEVQAQLARWHQHLCFFYTPTLDMLRGLGEMYVSDPRFKAFYDKLDPHLAAYLKRAIAHYCDMQAGKSSN